MEVNLRAIIEKHQDTHLVSRDSHLVFLCTIVTDSCADFSLPLIELPVELTTGKFGHVILFVHTHALFDLRRQSDEVNQVQRLVLLCRISTLIWPVTSSQYFHIEVNLQSLAAWTLLEVLDTLL